MKPYLAIIVDSFRAALANRVLYVLLAIITLLLVAAFPLSYSESLDWKLTNRSLLDRVRLVENLVQASDDPEQPRLKAVWDRLPGDLQQDLKGAVERGDLESEDADDRRSRSSKDTETRKLFDRLVDALNNVIEDPDYFVKEDWASVQLTTEAAEMIKIRDSLTEIQVKRLNRILLSFATSGAVTTGAATLLEFYYGPFEITSTTLPQPQLAQYIGQFIPWVFDKFVMSIGILVAIIVTANMIPEMFDPGSLNLLLSKPISRSGLLLAKFIGGCAFTTICATYLLFGAWAYLGFRLSVWENSILYSIPLYLLVFAIYFSISTLAGIKYRSAILSVILTAVFWAVCFSVGSVYFWLNNRMENTEIIQIVPTGEKVLAVDAFYSVSAWDEADAAWNEKVNIFDKDDPGPAQFAINLSSYLAPEMDLPRVLTPVYDQTNGLVFAAKLRLEGGPGGVTKCQVAVEDNLIFQSVGRYPEQAVKILPSPRGVIVINRQGEIFGVNRDIREKLQAAATADEKFNVLQEVGQDGSFFEKFQNGLDDSVGRRSADGIALNWERNELVIYKRRKLTILSANDEYGFIKSAELDVATDLPTGMSCRVCAQGNSIVLALGNGEIVHIDRASLKETKGFLPESRSKVFSVAMSRDGNWFASVYADEAMWIYDIQNQKMERANVTGQKSISGVAFDNKNQLWVADRTDRVTGYDPVAGKQLEQMSPVGDSFKLVFRYLVRPIYLVFPKPSEVYKLVTHLSSNRDTTYNRNVDLVNTTETPNPWSPLWSGLGFMIFVLFLACVLFNYTEY